MSKENKKYKNIGTFEVPAYTAAVISGDDYSGISEQEALELDEFFDREFYSNKKLEGGSFVFEFFSDDDDCNEWSHEAAFSGPGPTIKMKVVCFF